MNWYLMNQREQKMYLHLLVNVQNPCFLTIGGLYPLNWPTCVQVISEFHKQKSTVQNRTSDSIYSPVVLPFALLTFDIHNSCTNRFIIGSTFSVRCNEPVVTGAIEQIYTYIQRKYSIYDTFLYILFMY